MNKLKVFSTFTGVGSPEMALKNININYDLIGTSEVDKWAIIAYDAIHNSSEVVGTQNKEQMLKEFKDRNIGYNFSTGKSEIPRNDIEIKKLYESHIRNKNYGDIRLINEKELPDFDLFTYSYPCKDISVAGLGKGLEKDSGTQSSLLWECERIIKYKKPKYLLMENVKNLVSNNHHSEFYTWQKILKDLGYSNYWKILNGKNFGVPQNRERVIMVSIQKEYETSLFQIPTAIKNNNILLKDILENEENIPDNMFIDPKNYENLLQDLPHQDISYCIDACYWKGSTMDLFLNKGRRQLVQIGSIKGIGDFESRNRVYSSEGLAPTLNSMNGGDRQPKILEEVRPILTPDRTNKRQNGRRVKENNDPSFTLTTQDRHGVVLKQDSKFRIRRLTPLECWRLMGYKDEHFYKAKDAGLSNTKLYERAGRGIVVPMLEEVFKVLLFGKSDKELKLNKLF